MAVSSERDERGRRGGERTLTTSMDESSLPNAVSPTRRRRILLGVFFHMYARRQRRRSLEEEQERSSNVLSSLASADADSSVDDSRRQSELRTLEEDDAQFYQVVCRICLEGNIPMVSTNETMDADSDSAEMDASQGMNATNNSNSVAGENQDATQQDHATEESLIRRAASDVQESEDDRPRDRESSDRQDDSGHLQTVLHQDQLIAPCNCTGSSEWVHVRCLRQWQRQALISAQYRHAHRCNVCTSPYLLPPPQIRRRNVATELKAGSLLVMKEESAPTGSTFAQKVILLLRYDGNDIMNAPCGIIINESLPHSSDRRVNLSTVPEDSSISNSYEFEWRKGGPVCGGRFGVLRYIVVHSNSTTIINPDGCEDHYQSRPIPLLTNREPGQQREANDTRSNISALQVVCEDSVGDDEHLEDEASLATLSGRELESLVKRLRQRQTGLEQSFHTSSQGNSENNIEGSDTSAKVLIFSGFCQWGSGQLEREIARGVWDVVPNGMVEDVMWHGAGVRSDQSNLWEILSQSQRVVPSHDMSE